MQIKKVCCEKNCQEPALYKVQCRGVNYFYVCEVHKSAQEKYGDITRIEFKNDSGVGTDFTPSQRWKVLERDGFKCQGCGRTTADGVVLHVDHITPKSLGGLGILENGQTLCSICNVGKGARVPIAHPTQHALDAATAARLPSSFSAEVINPAKGQGATRRAQ